MDSRLAKHLLIAAATMLGALALPSLATAATPSQVSLAADGTLTVDGSGDGAYMWTGTLTVDGVRYVGVGESVNGKLTLNVPASCQASSDATVSVICPDATVNAIV